MPNVHPPPTQSVLQYTGIPTSWLSKRPKLPSRNWLIFLTLTSSLTGLYAYDRRQCNRIRNEYVDRVKHLADEPAGALDRPRKVIVYGAKWPGDEDYDRSMRYFRKYIRPIFVAAAIDYEMIKGRGHGDIARRIAEEVKSRRRVALGLDPPPVPPIPVPTYMSPEETRKYELKGGIVILGRHTFKEFMAGLKRGWTDGLESVDTDEVLARELEDDGHFDEPEPSPEEANFGDGENGHVSSSSHFPSAKSSPVYSPLQTIPQPRPRLTRKTDSISPSMDILPSAIPNLPPLLLVPFTNFIGFTQIPYMIWDFFNQRHKCRAGAEAAYRLIKNETRPIEAPTYATDFSSHPVHVYDNDLDFDKGAESYFKPSFASTPVEIEKARKTYYDALPAKLEIARSLLRGTREMTKEENLHPPPTEVELRAERMDKEKRWRKDLEGWAIVNSDQEVAWDERFREALRVFVEPSSDE